MDNFIGKVVSVKAMPTHAKSFRYKGRKGVVVGYNGGTTYDDAPLNDEDPVLIISFQEENGKVICVRININDID
jgi:hypothetical protein